MKYAKPLRLLGVVFVVLVIFLFYHHIIGFHTILKANYLYKFEKCNSVNTSEYASLSRQSQQIAREIERMNKHNAGQEGEKNILSNMIVELEARLAVMARVSGNTEIERQKLILLGERLQMQIEGLQNPADCSSAEFVVTHQRECGFGCQVHHLSYAFGIALAMNRTFYVRPIRGRIWKDLFYPFTKCDQPVKDHIYLPTINQTPKNRFHPPTLPKEWADALEGLHVAPYAWFSGYLIRYLLRLKPSDFRTEVEESVNSLRPTGSAHDMYVNPVVGIHVRRGDKLIREAKRYELTDYMEPVGAFFRQKLIEYQLTGHTNKKPIWISNKTAILASDEPAVFQQAKHEYTDYNFIGSETRASTSLDDRLKALEGIILDVFLLSNADFLVCTFSSNVCRLVYELMMTHNDWYGDRSAHVQSLDDIYHIINPLQRTFKAISDYEPGNVHKGDIFNVIGNNWDGFVIAEGNRRLPAYLFEELPLRPNTNKPVDASTNLFKHL